MLNTRHLDPALLEANAAAAALLLRALSNEHRLMVLCQLVECERSVSELLQSVPLSQSALSQHLTRLREQALVKTRRDGQSIYYSISDPAAAKLLETLAEIFCPKDETHD